MMTQEQFDVIEDIENELGVKLDEFEVMKNNLDSMMGDLSILQLRLGKVLDEVTEFKDKV